MLFAPSGAKKLHFQKFKSVKIGLPITPCHFLERPHPLSQYLAPPGAQYMEKMLKKYVGKCLTRNLTGNKGGLVNQKERNRPPGWFWSFGFEPRAGF